MDGEIKKLFHISSFLLKSVASGLEAVAQNIEAMAQSSPGSAATTDAEPAPRNEETEAAPASPSSSGGATKTDIILGVIARADDGMDITSIAQETGFDRNTIRSAASRLRKQGKLTSPKKGVYRAS